MVLGAVANAAAGIVIPIVANYPVFCLGIALGIYAEQNYRLPHVERTVRSYVPTRLEDVSAKRAWKYMVDVEKKYRK